MTDHQTHPASAVVADLDKRFFTVVYEVPNDWRPGDDIMHNPMMTAVSWSHALHDRDAALARSAAPAPLPRWIDDLKGKDPTMDAVLEYFLCHAAPAVEPSAEKVAYEYSFIHSSATGRGDTGVGPCLTYDRAQAYGVGCFGQREVNITASGCTGSVEIDIEAVEKMADDLYNRGYRDARREKDQDARGCDEWQVVVDALAAPVSAGQAGQVAQVGCEGDDGLLRIHSESETCDVCTAESAAAPADAQLCTYPKCNCPFDAPADPNWCARGLKHGAAEGASKL